MLKTIVRTLAILLLVGFVIVKLTRNSISVGIGAVASCTDNTHCYYAGSVSLSDKTILSLTTAGSATLHNVSIEGKATIAGSLKATEGAFGSLFASGATTLDSITINDYAHVNGALIASSVSCGSLAAYGSATLSSVKVKGNTTVVGRFKATDSVFDSLTAWRGSHIVLTNSTALSIKVTKSQTDKVHPIELDGSTVTGTIEFEAKDGVVILRNGAQVTGEVIGGSIIPD